MKYRRMTYLERIELEDGLRQGVSQARIARRLGRQRSTIHREIKRGKWDVRLGVLCAVPTYSAGVAERQQWRNHAWRREPRKLKGEIRTWVIDRLQKYWSPEQICGRLLKEKKLRLTAETIYRMIERDRRRKHQGGGGVLWKFLRQARKRRRRRCVIWNRTGRRDHLPCISTRGNSANRRKTRGHWERDTMLGQRGSPRAVLVMVDRKTRFTRIGMLERMTGEVTGSKTMELMRGLTCKTITSDRGFEFTSGFETLSHALGAKVFFCHAYTARERGTNENTIGLLRQFFPKRFDIDKTSYSELALAQERLNRRPRKCLDWRTPEEVFFKGKTVALPT